jgi:hypothetical protein
MMRLRPFLTTDEHSAALPQSEIDQKGWPQKGAKMHKNEGLFFTTFRAFLWPKWIVAGRVPFRG